MSKDPDNPKRPVPDQHGHISNEGIKRSLPPGINSGITFGQLFVQMGQLKSLTYQGMNYLQDFGKGPKVKELFANFKFWGEEPNARGIYLKFQNGIQSKREQAATVYNYNVMVPESSFEQYIDDMGALIVDFYNPLEGFTIGTSKIIIKLYLKRCKGPTDTQPLVELRGTFPITLTGNTNVKIGEFDMAITSSFAVGNPGRNQNNNINLNEDSFEMNERQAEQITQNQRIHQQMNPDNRIPSSLLNRGATAEDYNQTNFERFDEGLDQRPTRDRSTKNSKFSTGKRPDSNFGNRKEIVIDENDDTITSHNDLSSILQRGAKLQQQMAEAINPRSQMWEQIHGIHEIPKAYKPPFLKDDKRQKINLDDSEDDSPDAIRDKIYGHQVDEEATGLKTVPLPIKPKVKPDYQEHQNLEELPIEEAERRQIKDMKFFRFKVKTLAIYSYELSQKLVNQPFGLEIVLPLPDIYQGQISEQKVRLSNYEILPGNIYAFNSLSLYNFRVDEVTLAPFINSRIRAEIPGEETFGELEMNKLLMCQDFTMKAEIKLMRKVTVVNHVKVEGKKKLQEQISHEFEVAGVLEVEFNLQSGDTEDEMKRNFQIKMEKEEAKRKREEEQRQAEIRKKMQFIMEQKPIFAQLYVHIEKLGENDNIGQRTKEQVSQAVEAAIKKQREIMEMTLNEREGEEKPNPEEFKLEQIKLPQRNLFVSFKAFPNLETVRTNTVWQKDEESEFNYRGQFPVLMAPESVEKMETFVLVLELWDQISPSVKEFLGLVKIPLAPICHTIKTTDEEVYSLNFLADQFCMYPMTVCDGFLPIYSPKLGQEIAHLKVTVSIGSPLQVNRLIQKEQEQERKRASDLQEKKIREAEIQKEKELKAARKAKKEKKRQLEEEQRLREQQEQEQQEKDLNGLMKLTGKSAAQLAPQIGKRGPTSPKAHMADIMQNMLRQSVNSQLQKQDYDQRQSSMLNCLRKMFEEARKAQIAEINGEEVFKEDVKNFDGTVPKDEVIFSLLNSDKLSLTRIEISQVLQLMLDINRNDEGRVDIDELQYSFKSYTKYYELLEQRIVDLLEKFKISIAKKFEIQELIDEFIAEFETRAVESKLSVMEFREIIEDRHGIIIRDALYDQFFQFFDLDRNQKLYITSFCEYMRNKSAKQINFFKVNTNVIANQISEFVRNSVETTPNCIESLEDDFKQEIWKNHQLEVQRKRGEADYPPEPINVKTIPADLLINQQINAKLFRHKLQKQGIALSLWETFTLFEQLNIQHAKMYFEPQRYHNIMFRYFYTFCTNKEYNRETAIKPQEPASSKQTSKPTSKPNTLMPSKRESRDQSKSRSRSKQHDSKEGTGHLYNIEDHGYNYGNTDDNGELEEGQGYWHRNDDSDEEDPRRPYKQIKHVFEIKVKELRNIPLLNKFICQSQNVAEQNMLQSMGDSRYQKQQKNQSNKYIQNVAVKYSFPLDEDEILESDYLQLNKDSIDKQGIYNYFVSMDTVHTYILSKEDNIKKVLEMCQTRGQDMGHPEADILENHNKNRREELFNMSIALYQDNREYIIGNSHLPIEDLIEMIQQFETKTGSFDKTTKRSLLSRTLFLYGTTYSQRENCIIGKLQLEVNYSQEKIMLSKREAIAYEQELREQKKINFRGDSMPQNPHSCFMHRETYINRKIPLNAKLSVLIDRVAHLKESIENIEHFHKIQHQAIGLDLEQQTDEDEVLRALTGHLSSTSQVHNRANNQHLDRRRVLHHILKHGMNLIVKCSMFEEDQELVRKFSQMSNDDEGSYGRYQTRMLYNSLNPVFGEVFELNLQMDTKIFEYLKNKRAVFEIRHYIVESKRHKVNKLRESFSAVNSRMLDDGDVSEDTIQEEDILEQCDFIVIGYVKVPLLQLITKNNGVDGDFSIFDEFKQKMGSLRLRITLNHHNSQRPLYSTSSKIPNQVQPILPQQSTKLTLIDQSINLNSNIKLGTVTKAHLKKDKLLLGINFIELILKNKFDMSKYIQGQIQRFYLKYRINGQVFQTKFLGSDANNSLDTLNILLQKLKMQRFDISKTNFIELDMKDQQSFEQAFGKPLEVQLWHKIESLKSYEKPIQEKMIGQFFIELNELPKIKNHRLKDEDEVGHNEPGKFQVYEGYFSMHSVQTDLLSSDRLGVRLYIFHKDENNLSLSIDEMSQIFNNYRPKIEKQIVENIDTEGTGYASLEELISVVRNQIHDEYVAQKLIWFMKSGLQFKSVDKVFYSPLFGLPPPFFKYGGKFDQIEIVCRFNEEFENLDSMTNGFIPANVFKNLLEGELNLKSKIVDDFIHCLRDMDIQNQHKNQHAKMVKEYQTLDVNLVTNSLKSSHIDYIVLLRKLSQFMQQNKDCNNIMTLANNKALEIQRQIEEAQEVVLSFEVDNGMKLTNPINDQERPNCYVYMKPNFQNKEPGQFVQTNVIKACSYPMWSYRSYNYTMPLNRFNLDFLETGRTLEFEVYHKAMGANSNNLNVEETSHLIGVAFVPLTGLIEGSGRTRLTGMFDVVNKNEVFQSVQTSTSLKLAPQGSQGKIKVCVNASINIRKYLDQKEGEERLRQSVVHNSIASFSNGSPDQARRMMAYPTVKNQLSFGRNEQRPSPTRNSVRDFDNQSMTSSTVQKLEEDQRMYRENLQKATDKQLEALHSMNMQELENLSKRIRDSMKILPTTDEPIQQSFGGHQTFKTDMMRSHLEQQMRVTNPFQHQESVAEDEDITRHEEPEDAANEELSQQTASIMNRPTVTYELDQNQSLKKESPSFHQSARSSQAENVFLKDEQAANEETFYDLEEMKRIENIIKRGQ